jgi:hypothetical protein
VIFSQLLYSRGSEGDPHFAAVLLEQSRLAVFVDSVAAEAGKQTGLKGMNPEEAIGSGRKLGYSDPSNCVDCWIVARWKT